VQELRLLLPLLNSVIGDQAAPFYSIVRILNTTKELIL